MTSTCIYIFFCVCVCVYYVCVDTFVCIHFIIIADDFISNKVLMSDDLASKSYTIIHFIYSHNIRVSPLEIRLQITDACYFIVNSI